MFLLMWERRDKLNINAGDGDNVKISFSLFNIIIFFNNLLLDDTILCCLLSWTY